MAESSRVLVELAAWIKSKTAVRDATGVIEEEGIEVEALPMMESFVWVPMGHPNAETPFRTAEGFPKVIRLGQPWPMAPFMTIIFGFEDETAIRLYALPNKEQAGPGEVLQPKKYTIDKSRFVITTQVMSFDTWRSLLTTDIVALASEGFDEEDEEDEEDEDEGVTNGDTNGQAVSTSGASAPGASATRS